ncbi:hypothetical protein LMG8526HA_00223 [Lactococcus lactis]|uniref:hypothetical protein n=1 Tax=Lactococcus lactis TaxID=1358 RepID=UPI00071C4089|nr:hypothetical protein [Lactococcus lactis]KSU12994.1 hypothetical protein LMG8526_0379 [Lactococcus lactis subsp. lactis]MDU0399386.1 hypothetical protein [Lactococcus lactis]
MYNLTIYLKRNEEIIIRDLKELTFRNGNSSKTITTDFSSLVINDLLTYNFKGSKQVSIIGSEISYLELTEVQSD